MNKYIEFKIQRNNAEITGFVDVDEIDDDENIQFYTQEGFENGYNLPTNPYNEDTEMQEWADYENLVTYWTQDDMFLQWLWDCRDEDRIIERPGYTLIINDGEKTLKKTTIKISQLTKDKLDQAKVHHRETYEEVILRLLSRE